MRDLNKIIVHCSDSDNPKHDNIETIRQWHTEKPPRGNGWSDVGYHFFIKSNGDIEKGRHISVTGAHVRGQNHDSIGICLHGKTNFTDAQFRTLNRLVHSLCFDYGIKINQVFGHRDFDTGKTCPNFDVKQKLQQL